MNDRARALAILKEAREILAKRLTEHVLDNADELLDDARGDSYMGEIESLYEQVGTPLAHLNQIISALPPDEEAPHAPETHAQHATAHSYAEIVPPAWPEIPALPAPRGASTETAEVTATEPPAELTFQTFAARIQSGDVEGAGHALAYLFDIGQERAMQCAQHFYQHLQADPEFLLKAMQLRRELASGGYNGALMLLYQCFGLSGIESIGVFQVLKARIQMGG